MAHRLLNLTCCGFVLGMLVGAFVAIAESFAFGAGELVLPDTLLQMAGSEAGALLAQMVASGLFGAIPMAGVVFYELDSWGLIKQAVVHYASYTVAFLVLGCFAGWISPTPADLAFIAVLFAVCHSIIWLIMYARYRAEVRHLNELLEDVRKE